MIPFFNFQQNTIILRGSKKHILRKTIYSVWWRLQYFSKNNILCVMKNNKTIYSVWWRLQYMSTAHYGKKGQTSFPEISLAKASQDFKPVHKHELNTWRHMVACSSTKTKLCYRLKFPFKLNKHKHTFWIITCPGLDLSLVKVSQIRDYTVTPGIKYIST